MTVLTYGLKAPDDGDQSSGASGWFAALRANFVAIDAHSHNGINSPLIAFANVSPLTTKGDLLGFSTVNARVAVGADTTVLTADSTQSVGWKWSAPASSPDASYELSNLALAASVATNAMTVSLKTKAGTNPTSSDVVKIGFRSSTAATGTYSQNSVTSSLSMVVSSGSTLGHADAIGRYVYVYAMNIGGGVTELAVSSQLFDEGSRQTTVAEAGNADSNASLYSTTQRTNVPVRLIGRMLSTQTTAGLWAAVPSEISLVPFAFVPIAARYTSAAGQSFSSSGTSAVLDLGTKSIDTHNCVTTGGSWVFTAPRAMVVRASCAIYFVTGAGTWVANEYATVEIWKAGNIYSEFRNTQVTPVGHTAPVATSHTDVVSLAAGETVQFRVAQTEGSSLSLVADGTLVYGSVVEIGTYE